MQEVKISKQHFDRINELQYDIQKKYDYISKQVIPNQYEISKDTVFFTYQDVRYYYLCFDGEEIVTGKIKLSSWIPNEKLKE